MKKVLIITYYWPPSGGAGVQRSLKFVKYLPEFGIEPIVITVDPSQATYPIIDETLLKEVKEGVRVIRTRSFEPLKILSALKGKETIPHGGFANNNKESITQKTLRFIRGNFFLPDARTGWVRFAVKAASDVIEKENVDTVFISSPPHSSQLVGLELKKKYKIRWIADMRDPWTDIYYYHDLLHTKFAAKRDAVYERQVLENADAVISVSEPINDLFLSKSDKLRKEKFHVIPNGFDESDFFSDIEVSRKEFVFTYVGTIADNYNPGIAFKAIRKFIDENPGLKVILQMVGTSSSIIQKLIDQYGLSSYTIFIDHVDHQTAVNYMRSAAILLLFIPDIPGADGILTGKLFEYIGSGRPIVGLGPVQGSAAAILNASNSGKMFDRNDYDQILHFINTNFNNWKSGITESGNPVAKLKYTRKSQTEELVKILLDQ